VSFKLCTHHSSAPSNVLAAGGIPYQVQTGCTDAPHTPASVSSLPQW